MTALLILPVTLAVILVISGIAKLRAPQTVDAAFRDLRVPAAADRPWIRRVFPWAEILLAVGLLVLPGWAGVVAAVLTAALFLAYRWLIARALGFEEPVSCGCFGEASTQPVSRKTLLRNNVFLALAFAWVTASIMDGAPELAAQARGVDWMWLVGAGVVAVTVWVTVREGAENADAAGSLPPETAGAPGGSAGGAPVSGDPAASAGTAASGAPAGQVLPMPCGPVRWQTQLEGGEDGYVRQATPAAVFQDREGAFRSLPELTATAARLLINVSPGCGSCAEIMSRAGEWARRLEPAVRLHLVTQSSREALESVAEESLHADALYDVGRLAGTLLGLAGTPTAVLLGADGLLAGGPVGGSHDIEDFVADILVELEEADEAGAVEE